MSKTKTSAYEADGDVPARPGDDLVFVFKDVDLRMEFHGEIDFDEESARRDLLFMAQDIRIDKTYVAFKGTKYENVFLKEEGWNQLSKYVWTPKSERDPTFHIVLRRAFEQMIIAYMGHIADLLEYDPAKIEFWVEPESDIKLRLVKDVAKEWERYPGPWQDWPENN